MNTDTLTVRKQALFELLKIGIGTSEGDFDFSSLSEEDWFAVMDESLTQTVGLLCFDSVGKISAKLPQNVYDKWLKSALGYMASAQKHKKAENKLTALLIANNISYVILKGNSSASYYPDPEKRANGDVDFIVKPEELEKTKQLLCDNGYDLKPDLSDIHYELTYDGMEIELHKRISGIPEGKLGDLFKDTLSDIVEEGQLSNGGCSVPSDYHHGIVIFLHTLHHMLSCGIGIRQLCDWACFVNSTLERDFWNEKMLPLLKSTGTYVFACALTEACVQNLNIKRPDWCVGVTADQCDSLMEEIYRSGNFGRKIENNKTANSMFAKNGKKLTFFGKIAQLFRSLNETNKKVYPVLNKAPYLYPFIMVYRIIRYLILMLIGERKSLAELSRDASEKNSFFLKYDLYKTQE